MMAIASVVGVFIFLPFVSANAFWIAVAAYTILASSAQMVVLNQMVSAIWIVRGLILGGDLPSVLWPSAVLGVLVLMFDLFERSPLQSLTRTSWNRWCSTFRPIAPAPPPLGGNYMDRRAIRS
jgi:hypothetical protein